MKLITTSFFLLLAFLTNSQSLSKLEHEVQSAGINNLNEVRNKTQEIFDVDPFNEIATYTLVAAFRYKNMEKKVVEHFAELKAKFPNNPYPYILSSYIQFPELTLKDTSGLEELKIALELDSENVKANQLLGRLYYLLFNESINQDHSRTTNFAKESRRYLVQTIKLDSTLWGYGIVINQLNYYLKDKELDSSLLDYKNHNHPRINILKPIAYYQFALNGTNELLKQIEEPVIKNINKGTSFRLEWIRTFHNPIVIRINSSNGKITVTWKRTDGLGGYYMGELVENETKPVLQQDFNEFEQIISEINFWEAPESIDRGYVIMDGSFFTFEGVINGKYHSIYRRSIEELGGIVPTLLSLTDLSIPADEMY